MKFDHIAIKSTDINKSVEWYVSLLDNAKVLYQDETWATVETEGMKFSFVLPNQHPPHFAVRVDSDNQEKLLKETYPGKKWKNHRDGSSSFYVKDPSGNFVEFIKYDKED